MTVQDAIVWNVGVWEDEEEGAAAVAESPQEEGGVLGAGEQAQQPQPEAPELQETPSNDYVTLLVTPQDALVLKYLYEMGADLDLALRSAGNDAPVITEPIWLRYVLDKYQIPGTPPELPVKMEQQERLATPTPQAPPTPVEE
jgi:hypothetical protein